MILTLMIFKQFNTNFMIYQNNCNYIYKNIKFIHRYRIFEYLKYRIESENNKRIETLKLHV